MLARIAQELFWLGRDLNRAEHTARMLDGVFHAELGGSDGGALRLSWDALLAVIGSAGPGIAPDPEGAVQELPDAAGHTPGEVIHLLTLDEDNPAAVRACLDRSRERALRLRDVISTEMWEALNTFVRDFRRRAEPDALRTGPYSVYSYVKERCALFWGLAERTMVRDQARAFLEVGAHLESADMVLRMLRVVIPPLESGELEPLPPVAAGAAQGTEMRAVALLHAVGGAQAYSRAIRQPPTVGPVGRFLLFEAGYPGSVASAAAALREALRASDPEGTQSPPLLRATRLIADLEFRARSQPTAGEFAHAVAQVQEELTHVDQEITMHYFAGTEPA